MSIDKNNQPLRQPVAELMHRIQENQLIQRRFNDFEFQLLDCRRLDVLLVTLLDNARQHFALADASLWLWDQHGQIARLLAPGLVDEFAGRLRLHQEAAPFVDLYPGTPQVRLGLPDGDSLSQLFPDTQDLNSVALMPLLRQQYQLGSLHFASRSADRYSPSKGNNFLHHLAAITAVCLENCIALEQLQWQGLRDPLTQTLNRRGFNEELTKELERACRQRQSLSCAFVDVDHFKQLNDRWGHPVGDQCLRTVASAIDSELRKTDLLGRYGGEEFVVLLPNCPSEEASAIAERIREAVAQKAGSSLVNQSLTVSVGVASWQPEETLTAPLLDVGEGLLMAADRAMYQAKQAGRNRVRQVAFNPATGLSQPE